MDANDALAWSENLPLLVEAIRTGKSVVVPTDTVYGIACDPSSPGAVRELFEIKKRVRSKPSPVLLGRHDSLASIVDVVPDTVWSIVRNFWPGAVTLVFKALPELSWDLGESQGTVALRMPDHKITLEILRETGPLAVSSANLSGKPAASSMGEAFDQFGEKVEMYVDAGPVGRGLNSRAKSKGSTIVDVTGVSSGGFFEVLREGDVSWQKIRDTAGGDWNK